MFHIKGILNEIVREDEKFPYLKRYFMNINSTKKIAYFV
jgi:hypothetical protein